MASNVADTSQAGSLAGFRVVAFESRRATEIAELIRRHGGEPIVAPSVREVPLSENSRPFEFVRRLEAGAIDVVVLMTGVGLRTLVEVVAAEWPRERLAAALGARHAGGAWNQAGCGACASWGCSRTLRCPSPTPGARSSRP